MLSKKDYEAFASILKQAKLNLANGVTGAIVIIYAETAISNYMKADNPRFDKNRFAKWSKLN